MSDVRAKFKVGEVASVHAGHEPQHRITLYPVTSGSPENEQFFKWTPGGKIELSVVNDTTAQRFQLGREYYVDFTLAEEV